MNIEHNIFYKCINEDNKIIERKQLSYYQHKHIQNTINIQTLIMMVTSNLIN